jgi:prepilin-type N-terminal cleavage/methylation domain-containing protein
MKRFIKTANRKGFTLVETLLATFILVVISTMLVNGFITTMGFSYQTSVYSKSGANNYGLAMDKLSTWNAASNCGAGGREEKGAAYHKAGVKTVTFLNVPGGNKIEELYVGIEQYTDLSATVPSALPFQDMAFAPKDGKDADGNIDADADDLSDNRKIIVYYPEYWMAKDKPATLGKVVVRADYGKKPVKYDWVVSPSGGTDKKENLASAEKIADLGAKHVNVGYPTSASEENADEG